jgi:hypothetical protein
MTREIQSRKGTLKEIWIGGYKKRDFYWLAGTS